MTHSDVDNPALAALARSGLEYRTVRHGRVGSLEEAARARGVAPSRLIKSMVVSSGDQHWIVLVPGGRKIAWPKLRAALGVNRAAMPGADEALALTGFERGTITPFGTRTPLPVIADALVGPGEISIGAGAHGVAAVVDAEAMLVHLEARVLDVTDVEPAG